MHGDRRRRQALGRGVLILVASFATACVAPQPISYGAPPLQPPVAIHPSDLLPLSGAPAQVDVSHELRPEQVGWLTLATSPALQALRAQRGVAGAQVVAAGILPNPQLSSSIDVPVAGQTGGASVGGSAGLSWSITSLLGRSDRIDSARESSQQVALDVAWQEWQTFFSAQKLAWQVAAQHRVLEVEQANLDDLSGRYDQLAAAAKKGLEPEVNALSAQTALERAKIRVIDARQALRALQIQLAEGLGHPELADVTIDASLDPPTWLDQLAEPPLLAHLDLRLDLRGLDAAVRAQSAAERAAALRAFPPIDVGANVARDTGNVVTAGVSIAIGLPVLDHGQAEMATARAERQRVAWERTSRLTSARAAVRTLLSAVALSRERIAALDAAVTQQRRLVTINEGALERGLVDAASYYLVRGELIDLEISAIQARLDLRSHLLDLSMQSGVFPLVKEGGR